MARIAIFVACFLLSASPAWAQAKSSIDKLNAEWMAAFNKGDAKALAGMYTPDAYVLPAGVGQGEGGRAGKSSANRSPSRATVSGPACCV